MSTEKPKKNKLTTEDAKKIVVENVHSLEELGATYDETAKDIKTWKRQTKSKLKKVLDLFQVETAEEIAGEYWQELIPGSIYTDNCIVRSIVQQELTITAEVISDEKDENILAIAWNFG